MKFSLSESTVKTPAAEAQPNETITLDQLAALVTGQSFPFFSSIRALNERYYEADCKDKVLLSHISYQKALSPYFLPSGTCEVHHNDETLLYNGVLQIDIDFKEKGGHLKAKAVKQMVIDKKLPYVAMCAISPSGYGVKMLVYTNNFDKTIHKEAAQQVMDMLSKILRIDIAYFDKLGASQPCYIPYDTTAYFNFEVKELILNLKEINATKHKYKSYSAEIAELSPIQNIIVDSAIDYLLNKQVNVATCYDEYFSFAAACINTFGEEKGKRIAYEVLSYSPQFNASNFAKFFHKVRVRRTSGNLATVGTIYYKATKSGWIPPSVQKLNNLNQTRTIIEAQPHQYLSNVLKVDKNILNKTIIAPTGMGKTKLILDLAQKQNVVMAVPTTALAQNVVADALNRGLRAAEFSGKQKQLKGNEQIIVTTYASLNMLVNIINTSKYILVGDEIHNITSASHKNFMLDEYTFLFDRAVSLFRAVTFLTGSYLDNAHPYFEALPIIEVIRPYKTKPFTISRGSQILEKVSATVKQCLENGVFPVVLLNNKTEKLDTLKGLLANHGIFFFNSEEKGCDEFQQISQNGQILPHIKGFVTTSVLKEGNNILDSRKFHVMIVGEHHSSTIQQFTSRFRNAAEIYTTIFKGKMNEDSPYFDMNFDFQTKLVNLTLLSDNFCKEANDKRYLSKEQLLREIEVRDNIQQIFIKKQDHEVFYTVDYLRLSNRVYTMETHVEYANDNYQVQQLAKFGFELEQTDDTDGDEITAAEKDQIKTVKAERKKIEQDNYIKSVDTLEKDLDNAIDLAQHKKEEHDLPTHAKLAFARFSAFTDLGCNETTALELTKLTVSAKNFKYWNNRILLYKVENDITYMQTERTLPIFIQKIRQSFSVEQTYSTAELRDRLLDCLSADKSICLLPFKTDKRGDKVLTVLRTFFNVEAICKRKKSGVVKEWKISNIDFSGFFKPNMNFGAEVWTNVNDFFLFKQAS